MTVWRVHSSPIRSNLPRNSYSRTSPRHKPIAKTNGAAQLCHVRLLTLLLLVVGVSILLAAAPAPSPVALSLVLPEPLTRLDRGMLIRAAFGICCCCKNVRGAESEKATMISIYIICLCIRMCSRAGERQKKNTDKRFAVFRNDTVTITSVHSESPPVPPQL